MQAMNIQGLGTRLGPHHTTLLITQPIETPLTLPAQWAGPKSLILYTVYIMFSRLFKIFNLILYFFKPLSLTGLYTAYFYQKKLVYTEVDLFRACVPIS